MILLFYLLTFLPNIFGINTDNLAKRINTIALEAKEAKNLFSKDDKVYLYGFQTNGKDTDNGRLACAKVVSIILIKAGVKIQMQYLVSGIENNLKNWKIVTKEKELLPGDVVVWNSIFKGNDNKECTGGGTCHVGIYTDDGFFHNNPLGDSPIFNGIGLVIKYKFK